MKDEHVFKGCIPAIMTPCDDKGKPDFSELVRKAKYLQEIGKIDESLKYLDELIKSTSSRANYSVWEIDELSNIHNHKAIVLKKEKRFNEEFIERLKSYCLRGISANLKSASKDKFLSKNFIPVLKHMLDPVKLLKFSIQVR